MKIFLIALLALGVASPAADVWEELIAPDELAHHLGISIWASKLRLQDSDCELEIFHVKNGKIVKSVLGGLASATDREFTRVAIQTSRTPTGIKVSMQVAAAAKVAGEYPSAVPLTFVARLPKLLTAGDFVLGGDLDSKNAGQGISINPFKITDINDGFLLRVTEVKTRQVRPQ